MNTCLPEFAPWVPGYPGSPCQIIPEEDDGTTVWPEMCINCGARGDQKPWWNRTENWENRKMITK